MKANRQSLEKPAIDHEARQAYDSVKKSGKEPKHGLVQAPNGKGQEKSSFEKAKLFGYKLD